MKDEYSDELVKQKNFDDGKKVGEKKKALEIAKSLLTANMDIDFISQTTNLSIDEIEKLSN